MSDDPTSIMGHGENHDLCYYADGTVRACVHRYRPPMGGCHGDSLRQASSQHLRLCNGVTWHAHIGPCNCDAWRQCSLFPRALQLIVNLDLIMSWNSTPRRKHQLDRWAQALNPLIRPRLVRGKGSDHHDSLRARRHPARKRLAQGRTAAGSRHYMYCPGRACKAVSRAPAD